MIILICDLGRLLIFFDLLLPGTKSTIADLRWLRQSGLEAAILKAEAEKEAAILRADGEAQAIRTVQQALAESLGMLNEHAPNEQVIKLKSLEAFQSAANGKATKIIIPSEIQGLAGLAAGVVETVKKPETGKAPVPPVTPPKA